MSRSDTSSPVSLEDTGSGAVGTKECEKMDSEIGTNIDNKEMALGDEIPSTSSGSSNINGMDRLLQQHRNEIMFELRRLQMGDRPVTGQGNKEAVEDFFTRAMNVGEHQATTDSDHRPQHVTVEVNALVERRPVSSILQSSGFRRNLENALRGALSNIPSSPLVVRPRTNTTTNRHTTADRAEVSTSPQPPSRQEQIPSSSRQTESRSQRQSVQEETQSVQQQPIVDIPQNIPSPRRPVSQSAPELARESSGEALAQLLHQVPTPANPSLGYQVTVQGVLEEAQREELIADISELVQRQLVTSSLEGDFRGRMERLMTTHLDATETDGSRVREVLQSLPPRLIPRNDFSHLGINTHALSDNLDDISVISATAAVAVPYAQSSVALSREMAAMKAQLTQLTNMMKMSFDVQLDIQRAIRQEVAAAVHNVMTDLNEESRVAAGPASRPTSQPARESHCLICLDQYVDTVLYQCGHMCVCYGCGMNLRSRGSHCPVCRAPIRDIIRAYKTNED